MNFFSVLDPVVLGALWGVLLGSSNAPACIETFSFPEKPASVTAFVNVSVIPMDQERVLANHTVLVERGRITAVGPTAQVKVPAGSIRVDGTGKYLMPGFFDMHAHLHLYDPTFGEDPDAIERNLFSNLAYGVTSIRDLGIRGPWLMRFRTGEIPRPRIHIAPTFEELKTTKPDSMTALVAAYRAAGNAFLEIPADYAEFPPGIRILFDSLLAAARQLNFPVASHTNGESFREMLDFGARGGSVEHLYAFQDTLQKIHGEISASEIQALAAATKRAGAWITVTLDCTEQRKKPAGLTMPVARQVVKALQDAGVGLLLGADADGGHGRSPGVLHEELAELVRAGLTPYQALLTGTRNAAQYFRMLHSSGTVAVGKHADLVLLYGNPLTNIRHTLEPAGVMVNGTWLDRVALDQGLLASPKSWIQMQIQSGLMPQLTKAQNGIARHVRKFEALADSLDSVPRATNDGNLAGALVQRMADEFAAIRVILTPEQWEMYDPMMRVWLREQTRKGYRVTIPGVSLTPGL